jgi:hypothetical protein
MHGSVSGDDILCALARIVRLAKNINYYQAFYYLLAEAGAEICSQPRAILEVRRHCWVLGDALLKSDQPDRGLRWYIVCSLVPSCLANRTKSEPDSSLMSW